MDKEADPEKHASEKSVHAVRKIGGITLRQVPPNVVTALALCFGLTAIRFAFVENWPWAVGAVVFAGVLDGMDGRVARLVKGESRFGAELDSLSDVIAFGVAPTILIYFWSLQFMPKFGWVLSLTLAVGCALRLARFNSHIDDDDQPHKKAGFLTGIPAPVAAGLTMLPIYLWLLTGEEIFREYYIVAPWVVLIAFLMISNTATYSWSTFRLRKNIRWEAIALIALLGISAVNDTWITLTIISILYLLLIPFSIRSYAKVKQQRGRS